MVSVLSASRDLKRHDATKASLLIELAFSGRNTRPDVAVGKSASDPHQQRVVAMLRIYDEADCLTTV
jgi:hypothetical protein